jgi:hypothetical protein
MNTPFSYEAMQVFGQTLIIMGQGMIGIFVVMGMIYGMIKVLMKLGPKLDKVEKEGE